MTQVQTAYRWRTCDLDSRPDTPWLRYEIIAGELIVSHRPHLEHAEILGKFRPRSRVRQTRVRHWAGESGDFGLYADHARLFRTPALRGRG